MAASYPNPELRGLRFGEGVPRPNWFYRVTRRVLQTSFAAFWKLRVFGRHHEPTNGSALYIANHQSFLDPPLMGLALRRPMNYMARDTLFRVSPFRVLIEALNAFPVKRGTADTGALKEAMRRLKAGGQVVVFAEGTRTTDGRIGKMLPGVALLAQRAADWVVPILIDGAFECWPRTQALPSPGMITVEYAPAISRADARKLKGDAFVEHVRQVLIDLQTDVRQRTGRLHLDYTDAT